MKKLTAAGLGVCAFALAFAAKDPVIMKVNGEDVSKSEFEYLFNKNSQQQINPQSLDEYVEMFKLYKMKVADARAEGIDTTAAFLKEAEQYRHELAAPYMVDSVLLNRLVDEAYDRSQEEVEAYHIMLFKTRSQEQNRALRQRADSLLQALRNGADFATLAEKYSQDRGSNARGGRMGWVVAGTYPVSFEIEAWKLPLDRISDEVVESPVGYHILKGGHHRPARGKVRASHILKLTQAKSPASQAIARREIDSLLLEVKAHPEAFAKIASENSEDRQSARQGGALPPFGAGEMVEPFDSAAFSLMPGQISDVVVSPFGYHIIKVDGKTPVPSREEIKPLQLQRMVSPQDPRAKLIARSKLDRLAKKHKGALNDKTISELRAAALANGVDSAFLADWTTMPKAGMTVASVGKKTRNVADLLADAGNQSIPASEEAADFIDRKADVLLLSMLTDAEEEDLLKTQPEYRNLLKEYVDGSLLYEVSVRKVWDKAARDTEGLNRFFEANRDNYRWTEPHAKGILVQASNDSVAAAIRDRAVSIPDAELASTLRKEFKGEAQFDKVLVAKGSNSTVDYLMFGGAPVNPSNTKYSVVFMLNPRVIMEPEDVNDVKGMVTSDYQNEYQEAWENELRSKYPVVVDEKVLRQVKTKK